VFAKPFSLYIHIPYCLAKCPYCDFNSHAAQSWPEERYTGALCREMDRFSARPPWTNGELQTVFFGGGTPSLFAPDSVRRILDSAYEKWPASSDVEVTLEANPGTISVEKLAGFRQAGVNRLSFGVQSFHERHLRTLGRIHDGRQAADAIGAARRAGFDNVSLDLIFALPEQRLEEWVADVQQARRLEPDHISAYNLTYEEGTPFHQWRAAGRLQQLPESTELAMFESAQQLLGDAGYDQYEISNYAQPGRECRHNLNYWRGGAYLGVGAGAHSYSGPSASRMPDSGAAPWGERWSNRKSPGLYMDDVERRGEAVDWSERLEENQARGELVFLGLRCLDGFADEDFTRRFGCTMQEAFPHALDLRQEGLLRSDEGRWSLTERGLLLADSIFATFL
jgi:oxygen-independent coproporphyrinogen-3 oxidase